MASALVALALTTAGIVLSLTSYLDAREGAVHDLTVRARGAAADTRLFAEGRFSALAQLADSPAVASASPERIATYLASVPARQIGFTGGLAWVDGRGIVRAATGARADIPFLSSLPAIDRARSSGRPQVGIAVDSRMFAAPAIPFVVATRDREGRRAGSLVGAVRLDLFAVSARSYPLSPGSLLSIVDGAGRQIAGPGVSATARDVSGSDLVRRIASEGAGETIAGAGLAGGGERIVAWSHDARTGWALVVERPTSTAFASARHTMVMELLALGVLSGLGVVAMLVLGRRFDRLAEAQDVARANAERRQERAETLQRLTSSLSRARSPSAVQEALLDVALHGLGSDVAVVKASATHGLLVAERGAPVRSVLDPPGELSRNGTGLISEVTRTGNAVWVEGAAGVEERAPDIAALAPGCRGVVALPFLVGGEVVGVLALAGMEETRFSAEDRQFQLAVAGQGAQALERARLVAQEHEIAVELQRALLPTSSPGGASTGAVYRPAEEHLAIGGDWYDAIELPDGRVLLVVGDVVGHGVRAAAVMGQMRTAIAALATVADGPAELLRRLDSFALQIDGAEFSTVACATIDPRTGVMRSASAGHPPIVVVDESGIAAYVMEGRTVPLCVGVDVSRAEDVRVLAPGSTVIMFSDGLYERRDRPFWKSLEDVLEIAGEVGGQRASPSDIVDALVDRMLDGAEQTDDIAVLALRLGVDLAPATILRTGLHPDELAGVRTALRGWLAGVGAGDAAIAEMTLAVHEAVANAMEHAYGHGEPPDDAEVSIEATAIDGRIALAVADQGRWVDDDSEENRGRGLLLIRGLVDELDIIRGTTGTRVRMLRVVAPAELVPGAPGAFGAALSAG